jgi:hypothetical protein
MPVLHAALDREDELSFVAGLPASLATSFDPESWDAVEWARQAGLRACWQRVGEGATFVDLGDRCWLLGMKGAQFLHSDRHMADVAPEQEGHCWNAVVEADGDQMLLVRETEHAYRHHRLEVGSLVYFNTYQPHLVSRSAPDDACVIVQVGGIGPDEPDRAVEEMGRALERAAFAARGKRAA